MTLKLKVNFIIRYTVLNFLFGILTIYYNLHLDTKYLSVRKHRDLYALDFIGTGIDLVKRHH